VHSRGIVRFWAGGGIVADSQRDAEYQETFDKAAALLNPAAAERGERQRRRLRPAVLCHHRGSQTAECKDGCP